MSKIILGFTHVLAVFAALLASGQTLYAQEIFIPRFWDARENIAKTGMEKIKSLKFITTTDFPPFNFIGPNNMIAGFHVDLARAICAELDIKAECLIQAVPWKEQVTTLFEEKNAAILSGLAISAKTRQRLSFTRPYLMIPGRFIAVKKENAKEPLHRTIAGKTIGVIDHTAHQAFLQTNFGALQLRSFLDHTSAFTALREGKIDGYFSDAVTLANWLHSEKSGACCQFIGGAYLSQKYFGHGLAIAVDKDNELLLRALNSTLRSLSDKGTISEIYLRYFPIGLF